MLRHVVDEELRTATSLAQLLPKAKQEACVAQWLEHLSRKQGVVSSILAVGSGLFFFLQNTWYGKNHYMYTFVGTCFSIFLFFLKYKNIQRLP